MPDPKQLTLRQAQILGIIVRCIEKNGVPPTFRELADLADITSPSGVYGHLKALTVKGWLTYQPRKARSIRLAGPSEVDRLKDRIAELEAKLESNGR